MEHGDFLSWYFLIFMPLFLVVMLFVNKRERVMTNGVSKVSRRFKLRGFPAWMPEEVRAGVRACRDALRAQRQARPAVEGGVQPW